MHPRRLILPLTVAAALAACSDGTPTGFAEPRLEDGARRTRIHYIAADEVEWNYAPDGFNRITGAPWGEVERVFVEQGPDRIGSTYVKALYREYTDATFGTLEPREERWRHLGVLGPLLRAVVGDTLVVVFRNNTRQPVSMHPHGVFYDKGSEGSPYDDGASGDGQADDLVPPGGTHTYLWVVNERAGPGPGDGSSIVWSYHSHVDEPADANAGLIGPIIVTRRGAAHADGTPRDVDREFVTLFTVFDENTSWLLDENIERFAGDPASVDPDDEGFEESNLMHTINGFVYGNLPAEQLTMRVGERVRWYLIGMGTEVDLHTPHWHGQSVLVDGKRTDLVELLPMSLKVADMRVDNPGTWLFHCHVDDHIYAGMLARVTVLP